MQFLADENVAVPIVAWLRELGHDVLHASDQQAGAPDADWLSRAEAEERLILTSDKDFGELVFRDRLNSHGVVLLRLETLTVADRISRLKESSPLLRPTQRTVSSSSAKARCVCATCTRTKANRNDTALCKEETRSWCGGGGAWCARRSQAPLGDSRHEALLREREKKLRIHYASMPRSGALHSAFPRGARGRVENVDWARSAVGATRLSIPLFAAELFAGLQIEQFDPATVTSDACHLQTVLVQFDRYLMPVF